jgi:V8-like Glu-specific endopeptidase
VRSIFVLATVCLWSAIAAAAPFTISLDSGNTVIEQTEDSLSLLLNSDEVSRKGIGISGSDTKGKASAQASARVTIRFDGKWGPAVYIVRIGTPSSGVTPTIRLSDHLGKNIPIEDKRDGKIQYEGKPNDVYYLELGLSEHAENHEKSSTKVDLQVLKAPILASRINTKIYGGSNITSTTNYKAVGALLIDNKLHCTATLIGPKTLLTAAHCLQGYKGQEKSITFILGSDKTKPEATYRITNFIPHDSFDPDPSSTGYHNDIGLVYLSEKPSVELVPLHRTGPIWEDIQKSQTKLTFVGFGYNMEVDGQDFQEFGIGIKRYGSWPINEVRDRHVVFDVQGMSTCNGDSGGPAFLMIKNQLVQVAVTSGGYKPCTKGFSTRVDSFLTWLDGKIK